MTAVKAYNSELLLQQNITMTGRYPVKKGVFSRAQQCHLYICLRGVLWVERVCVSEKVVRAVVEQLQQHQHLLMAFTEQRLQGFCGYNAAVVYLASRPWTRQTTDSSAAASDWTKFTVAKKNTKRRCGWTFLSEGSNGSRCGTGSFAGFEVLLYPQCARACTSACVSTIELEDSMLPQQQQYNKGSCENEVCVLGQSFGRIQHSLTEKKYTESVRFTTLNLPLKP